MGHRGQKRTTEFIYSDRIKECLGGSLLFPVNLCVTFSICNLKPSTAFNELHNLLITWHEIRAAFSGYDDGPAGISHSYTFI